MTNSASLVITSLCVLVGLFQSSVTQRQLCGRDLANTLDLVCAGRGFHLGKRSGKPSNIGRSVGMVYGRRQTSPRTITNRLKSSQPDEHPLVHQLGSYDETVKDGDDRGKANDQESNGRDETRVDHGKTNSKIISTLRSEESNIEVAARFRRNARSQSIVDECCLQACTFSTLESYCAEPEDPVENLSLNELRVRMGFASRRPNARTHRPTFNRQTNPSAQINRGRNGDQTNSFFYLSLGQQATRRPLLQKRPV